MIATERLTKTYAGGKGVRDVTLTVRQGTIFGLLGPNGAGKSTLVKMLVGLLVPTAGNGAIAGFPLGSGKAREQLGYLPELFRYPEWLTPLEVLDYHARLSGLPRSERRSSSYRDRLLGKLDQVGLREAAERRIRTFSKGMQQRLGLAVAMLTDPPLILLDEPSSALDPLGRHDVRELLKRLRDAGTTVFLNTHLLEDVEEICDEAAFLSGGRLLASGTVRELWGRGGRWVFRVGGWLPEAADALKEDPAIAPLIRRIDELADGFARIEAVLADEAQAGWIVAALVDQGLAVIESAPDRQAVEDWFLTMSAGGGKA